MGRTLFSIGPSSRAILAATAGLWLGAAPIDASATCDGGGLPLGTKLVELRLPASQPGDRADLAPGSICIELLDADAPLTVANFLDYVGNRDYDQSVLHRFEPGFVLQGGDLRRDGNGGLETIPPRSAGVPNEPCTRDTQAPNPNLMICSERGNERGTVALAKQSGNPSSGTTNWFINLADNRENLDNQNGGFTVFGRVIGDGMAVVDALVPNTPQQQTWVTGDLFKAAVARDSAYTAAGCFDPLTSPVSVVVFPQPGNPNPLGGKLDPRTGQFPFLLPTTCGGSVVAAPENFAPVACNGVLVDESELAIQVTTAYPPYIPTSPSSYTETDCADVDTALALIDQFQADYVASLVSIETARALTVPEPSARWVVAASVVTLGLLARRPPGLLSGG